LNGWDESKSFDAPPTPSNHYHRASASIGSATATASISGSPPYLMMLAPTLHEYLPDAVRHGTGATLKRVKSDRGDLWEIAFQTTVGVPASYRVTVDPSRGYALSRKELTTRTKENGRSQVDVLDYEEVEPGLFIPVRIRISIPDQPGTLRELRVKNLKVNQPVPADALTLRFPQGMKVQDTRKNVAHIWGVDGPERTFATEAELVRYEQAILSKRSSPWPWLFIFGVASLLITAVLWRLLRSKARSEHA
jgi:hypothetical protein